MMPKHEPALNHQRYEMHPFSWRPMELMDGIQMNKLPAFCFTPQVPKQQNLPFLPQVHNQQYLSFMPQVPEQQYVQFMSQVSEQQNLPFAPQVSEQQNLPFGPQVPKQQNLPFGPQVPKQQNLPFVPQVPKQQNLSFVPQGPKQQNLAFMPQVPKQQNLAFMPQVPKQQNLPFTPQVPKQQNLPFMPQVPKQQNLAFMPQVPKQQNLPFLPQVPKQQNLPFMPQGPKQQNLPSIPQGPKQQNLPFMPEGPKQQNVPSWLFPSSQYGERKGVENFGNPSAFLPLSINHVSSGHHHDTVKSEFKQQPVPSSLGRNKFGKRMLDLELPAEVYLVSDDDEEQVEEKRIPQIHPVLHSPSVNHVAASREGTLTNSSPSYQSRQCVFDLNEPAKADELIVSKSSMPSSMIRGKIKIEDNCVLEETGNSFPSGHQLSGKNLPFSCNERAGLGSEVSKNEHNIVDSKRRRLTPPVVGYGKRLLDKPTDGPRMVVQALPCFNTSPLNGISSPSARRVGIKQKNKVGFRGAVKSSVHSDGKKAMIDLNLNDIPETEACQENFEFSNGRLNLDLNAVPACCSSETGVSDEHNDSDKSEFNGKMIDLNAKLLEPNSSCSQLSALTSVTSASSSSEFEQDHKNEKSAIPGTKNNGDDEIAKETALMKSSVSIGQPEDPCKEVETTAAEIIISMSLSDEGQHFLKNGLNWFAEIILREAKTFKSPVPGLRKRARRARNAVQKVELQRGNRATRTRSRTAKVGRNVDFATRDEGRGKRKALRSGLKQQLVEQSWLFVWGKRSRRQKHKRV